MLNRKIRILGIAPYESLKNTMIRAAGERDDIDLTVEVGNIEAGAAVAKKYEGEDFDAILSRGGTKIEIEKVTQKPVFDIPISYYDLLSVIRLVENYKGKAALISYENIARSARVICDILHTQYDIFIIDSWRSSAETVRKLKEEGYSLIIGDVVSVTHAEDQGLQSMLLISGPDSVCQAFDTVVQVCAHYSRLRQENAFFQAFVHSREDRLLAMDKDGNVVFSTFPVEKKSLLSACRKLIPSIQAGAAAVSYRKVTEGVLMISGSKSRLSDDTYFFFSIQKNRLGVSYLSGYKSIEVCNAEDLSAEDREPHAFGENLSAAMRQRGLRIARSDTPVLITGESGTEKEVLAQHIYLNSAEAGNPYFIISCVSLTRKELEYFLGSPKSPLYSLHGTVHFKGVHHLSESLFEQLLTGLQGMSRVLRCRLIFTYETRTAETSEDHYRLNAVKNYIGCVEIALPPLREHPESIANLAVLHIHQQNRIRGTSIAGLEPESIGVLEQYAWPQNLNQLRRVLNEAMLNTDSPWITAKDLRRILSSEPRSAAPAAPMTINLHQPLSGIEYDAAMLILSEENMNQVRTAERLGISRTTLWRLLRRGPAEKQQEGTAPEKPEHK